MAPSTPSAEVPDIRPSTVSPASPVRVPGATDQIMPAVGPELRTAPRTCNLCLERPFIRTDEPSERGEHSMSSVVQPVVAREQVRLDHMTRGAAAVRAVPLARWEAPSGAAALIVGAVGTLLVWSASYLVRQTGFAAAAPAAAMQAALEGMALALVWLAALVGGCAALLCGAVAFKDPESSQ